MDLRCPFCDVWDETLEHIFVCDSGLNFPKILQNFNMECISGDSHKKAKSLGEILIHIPRRTVELKEGYIFRNFFLFLNCFLLQKVIFNCKGISIICLDFVSYCIQTSALLLRVCNFVSKCLRILNKINKYKSPFI